MKTDYDITVSNSNMSTTYPGALLVANSKMVEGSPTPLGVARAPITVTSDFPGLIENNRITVEKPDFGSVKAAINNLIQNWCECQNQGYTIPGKLQCKKSILYSAKTMELTFGCDVDYMQKNLGINFNLINNEDHSAYLMQFRQIFYTISVEPPKNPADVFDDNVTWEELSRKMDNANPPAYVQNVQYGREIYLLLEANMSSSELKAQIEGHVEFENGKIDFNGSTEFNSFAKSIKSTLYVLGGDIRAVQFDKELVDEVNGLINKNLELSVSNPATPLCYTTAFLRDNMIANISGKTEYITTKAEMFSVGQLKLVHNGAYVAKFYVSWDCIEGFDENGNEKLKHYEWEENGKHKTSGFKTMIVLPANAKNICVKAQGSTGLVWDKWHTPVNSEKLPLVPLRTITISGTTLNQKGKVEP